MKKYKQVLAAFLAMNLSVYVMPTGVVKISASVESQSNEDTTETADSSESVKAAEQSAETGTDDAAGAETGNSDTTEETEPPSSDEEEVDVDITEDVSDSSDTEDSGNADSSEELDETFSDGAEANETAAAGGEAVQAAEDEVSKPVLAGFLKVKDKTIDITDARQLILLSNCDPNEIKDLTINLQIANEIDLTAVLKQGTNISDFYSVPQTASADENQQTSTESSDSAETQNNDSESAEVQQTESSEPTQDTAETEQSADTAQDAASAEQTTEETQDTAQTDESQDTATTENVETASQDETAVQAGSATTAQEYTFKGIGTSEVPFCGQITGNVKIIKTATSFFGGLSSNAQITVTNNDTTKTMELTWCGDGTKPMIADTYQFDNVSSDGNHSLPVTVVGDSSEGVVMGSLFGTIQEKEDVTGQTLTIGKMATYNNVTVKDSEPDADDVSHNAGLICRNLKSGGICLDGYEFPTSYEVEATKTYDETNASAAGNAGGVIGVMEKDTTLTFKSAANIPDGIKVTSASGNAGGLVGLMEQGSRIITEANAAVTLNTPNVIGGAAGGVAGMATDVIFADGDRKAVITVTNPTVSGTEDSASTVGGFIGKYVLNAANLGDTADTLTFPSNVEITTPTLTVTNNGFAGGYFGHLNLNGKVSYTIAGTDDTKKEIKPTYTGCNAEACGAIAGKVTSTDIASTLLIQNVKVTVNNSSDQGIQYHGGLVGELGEHTKEANAAYLKVSNAEINVTNPQATDSNINIGTEIDSHGDPYGFGGISGLVAQDSILQTEGTVTISASGEINQGGGLVGCAEKSVINLSGITDLSGMKYGENTGEKAKTGWLVGWQNCALIYANGDGNGNGWSYIRGKENTTGKQAMNDIGNYGQIIRLKSKSGESKSKLNSELIKINESHEVKYNPTTQVEINENAITLGSEDAFALLSIAWNSRGCFGRVTGITANNIPKANIQLSADINLTGSGIAGLSRDAYSANDAYSGTFNGNGHTITLAIGETFGFKQDDPDILAVSGDDGYGEVISSGARYHGRQGLFAKTANKAVIKDVTIDGSINVSNAGSDILAGGIAGEVTGITTVSGVKIQETIAADSENNQLLMVGGFFGGSYDKNTELVLGTLGADNTLNTAAAIINIEKCTSVTDTKIIAGGVVGEVGESDFKFTVNNLTVGGSITTPAEKRAYVGGLIGVIKGDGYDSTHAGARKHTIEIKGVKFDGFTINAENAKEVCGGLFGSVWADVRLYFMGESDADDGSNVKLEVSDATINAPNADAVGGLVYRSSGTWEIRNHGISLEKLNINAGKNVGLLVCHGEDANDQMFGNNYPSRYFGALYLSTTKHWDSSYAIDTANVSITTTDNSGVFDEFVAYTTPEAKYITDNDRNGVISLATEDITSSDGSTRRVGVDADDATKCTTYQNRTKYGQSHKTNSYSRYYYDLDQCLKEAKNNATGSVDSPAKLLLWSVYTYASGNIKNYFRETNDFPVISENTDNPVQIGSSSGKVISLDMEKYSYYPVKTASTVNIANAEIKFHNKEIEDQENKANNKSTQSETEGAHTQHYTMHCGLLLQHTTKGNIEANNVTFSGSIGKVNNSSSGALVADQISGNATGSDQYISEVTLEKITLNNLKVNGYKDNEYAPLLINSISQYMTLTVDDLTTRITDSETGKEKNSYTGGTAVASSLIGTVGSDTAKQINMTFKDIVLPDKKADGTEGIFSHATLLESFAYDKDDNASGGTYNFYSYDDWGEAGHKHKVTYGNEIQNTTEFRDDNGESLQKWYYDESTYQTKNGLVYDDASDTDRVKFNSGNYLQYVCVEYNNANSTHEIKVNQRVVDITEGCGTYGHPYRIQTEAEMNILSEYMSTGIPRKDWRVTVTGNQSKVHTKKSDTDYTSDDDVTYQYDGAQWVQVENTKAGTTEEADWQPVDGGATMSRDFMLQYLLNAYYDIQGMPVQNSDTTETTTTEYKLVLNNFKGFGTASNPFRGVLTTTNTSGVTVVLKGENTANGLIPYSYGSVVTKLKISYEKTEEGAGKTLTNSATSSETNSAASYYPTACFGGVIGCVMGGDNIIDGVSVTMAQGWLTLAGDKKHLIQVGGYVGSVAGGGVIFRDMKNASGLTDDTIFNDTSEVSVGAGATYSLYVNPYVGRVLDGFAFYESDLGADADREILANTNKNYKINTIVPGNNITASGNNVTVNDKQGLLLLSAIVNSGAGSNGSSRAYSTTGESEGTAVTYKSGNYSYFFGGKYGKVRNASYDDIGSKCDDATLAETEEIKLPGSGNLPYLISEYCNKKEEVFKVSDNSSVEISLASDGNFDMTGYRNGYQGIAARYVSNAVLGVNGNNAANNPEGVVPELTSFNGNGKTVKVDMQVSEYADDDFHAASVGGVFNILRLSDKGTVSDVTVEQAAGNTTENAGETTDGSTTESTDETTTGTTDGSTTANTAGISLTYYGAAGQKGTVDTNWGYCKEVGLGGLAGSLVGYADKDGGRDVTISKIRIDGLQIDSPASAGGIFGNTGKPVENNEKNEKQNKDIAVLLQPQTSQIAYGIAFNDCSYTGLTITGKYAAGGFVGYIGNKGWDPGSSVNGDQFTGALSQTNTGENSTIVASDGKSYAGGLFGYVGTRMFINMTAYGVKNDDQIKVILQGVSVEAGTAVGGCIGYINEKCYGIHNVTVKGTTATDSQTTSPVEITLNSTTKNSTAKDTFYTGGIVGYAKGAAQNWTSDSWKYAGGISGSRVENVEINDVNISTKHDFEGAAGSIKQNYIAGGIIGYVAGGSTIIESCKVSLAKVYGAVSGGITGQTDSEMQFLSCETSGDSEENRTELKGFSTAGGILGFWTGNQKATIQKCKLQYLEIEGKDWGVGAFIGDADGGGVGWLYLFDSSAQNSKVTASGNRNNGGGRWPRVGGVIGNLRNKITASNILFSDVTLDTDANEKGLLFGGVVAGDINIAGISIQNIPDANADWSLTGAGSVSKDNDYIAFSDYSGTQSGNSEDLLGHGYEEKENADIQTDVEDPYVVTSPKSSLALYESEDATAPKYIYSDGAFQESDGTVEAQKIWKNKDKVTDGHYAYSLLGDKGEGNTSLVKDFDFDTAISTYRANQQIQTDSDDTDQNATVEVKDTDQEDQTDSGTTTTTVTDFPVLQISTGDVDKTVTDYLNILTNGGFSAANNMKKVTAVSATVDVYNEIDGRFVKDTSSEPAFKVKTDKSTGKITFATTTDYDNGKNRFNLLKVTFEEKDADNKTHHYNVFVPVLVRRMLEIDFVATLTYGTDFRSEDYKDLTAHVLESYGSTISGYLNFIYDSAKGVYADYGWESYINAGGDMMDMKKSIRFTHGITFPKGTQLSLVDCRNGKVYYYTTKGAPQDSGAEKVNGNSVEIPLNCFVASDGTKYEEPSISELLEVTASTKGSNKPFVKVDKDGKPLDGTAVDGQIYSSPTVKIKTTDGKYEYYRLAEDGETGQYAMNVPSGKDGTKSKIRENYYLVMTVPKQETDVALQGSIQTTITTKIPKQVHYRNISGKGTGSDPGEDIHDNTASTYMLSNGYEQNLVETDSYGPTRKVSATAKTMRVSVRDQITFPNGQIYNNTDQLYMRFVGALQKTTDGTSSAEQFPKGTSGNVEFYVYTGSDENSRTYYTYNGKDDKGNDLWLKASGKTASGINYEWESDGRNMELPLSTDGTQQNAVSLAGVRSLCKGATGSSTFYVEAVMTASLPDDGLDVIPESRTSTDNKPVNYAKLTYVSQLSVEKSSLSYSTNRATLMNTMTYYYRDEAKGAELTYDADKVSQLGINLLDLIHLDADRTHSLIDTTATYDLSSMRESSVKKLEDTLKNSTGIRFTLSLIPKKTGSTGSDEDETTTWAEQYKSRAASDAADYLDVVLNSENSGTVKKENGTWTWTVPQATYYKDGAIQKNAVFDGEKLTQAIQLKVNVDNVETKSHFYSNYEVFLQAEIMNENDVVDGTTRDDNIIYTLAKIQPQFVD